MPVYQAVQGMWLARTAVLHDVQAIIMEAFGPPNLLGLLMIWSQLWIWMTLFGRFMDLVTRDG